MAISFFIAGCLGSLSGAMALKRYSAGQKEIASYVKAAQYRFDLLAADIAGNALRVGLKRADIVGRYGEPVLDWKVDDAFGAVEKLLYRKPVEYFSTDRIYLYFDKEDRLVRWEYCPVVKHNDGVSGVKKNN